jgi:F0F1-type ATP synthase assembly protein I
MERILKILFWLRIFISPLLFGVILGLVSYAYLDTPFGQVVGILFIIIGLILGVIFAEKARKKHGTLIFMSKVSSTTLNSTKDESSITK